MFKKLLLTMFALGLLVIPGAASAQATDIDLTYQKIYALLQQVTDLQALLNSLKDQYNAVIPTVASDGSPVPDVLPYMPTPVLTQEQIEEEKLYQLKVKIMDATNAIHWGLLDSEEQAYLRVEIDDLDHAEREDLLREIKTQHNDMLEGPVVISTEESSYPVVVDHYEILFSATAEYSLSNDNFFDILEEMAGTDKFSVYTINL